MSDTVKQFRKVTPQAWKPDDLEIEDWVDGLREDPTVEYFITDEDDFKESFDAFEDEDITAVYVYGDKLGTP